jgi:hypothetical protein
LTFFLLYSQQYLRKRKPEKRNKMEALFQAIGEFFAWLLARWTKKE